jgi:two-component system, NtrC family, response regulator HydG
MTMTKGTSMHGTIVVVDDNDDTAELLGDLLRKRGHAVTTMGSAQQCVDHVQLHPTDVVVTDVRMPGVSGIDLCQVLHDRHPELLSIVLTGHGDTTTAIAAIHAGAYDFITKPVTIDILDAAIGRALDNLALEREVKRLKTTVRDQTLEGIAGDSRAIRETIEMIWRVADTEASVLVTGESGTGKELVARALHALSRYRDEPFVAVNCAAMPPSLLESELFGHVRGAFTDATHDRKGLFASAGRGTILLDEIGEMPIEMQVKLLRVLQQRTVRPVGGNVEIPFEARLVTSTNRDLEIEVAEKRFREDLYYRINVVQITVPALRDRAGDISSLAQHFVEEIARRGNKPVRTISTAAAQLLAAYDWPGNVRELENCMERAVALCRTDEIMIDDLPEKVQSHKDTRLFIAPGGWITMSEMSDRYIHHVLAIAHGNKTRAARILGVNRRSLYRRLTQPPPQLHRASTSAPHAWPA